ncbi:NAD(P)-dependent dehydrogenase (short-subunit alcohol dehydrogenase family) [Panacagrimonas perspica]|uniref:NAD(P)-dependent dehydrogenase (Short-subunit alcohol dehydrogenase family) n=1 Tax=Panacagrimonas perspica TaxID=381431 RepID=A0A4S3K019_9GAMM|nr:SDR family oxidoreductase [Panacagrimonas perspica]TDU28351.1 NAD(P)-dependent dehydrogenase (short-subunit alcohol dehydrogenase family) [Panacagrimonas perspica]THD01229.1 oxidoreductase [Panacagrimonas perspica]
MTRSSNGRDLFSLDGRVVIITGGGGMLGYQHAATVASLGGKPVLLDISEEALDRNRSRLIAEFGTPVLTRPVDITDPVAVEDAKAAVLQHHGQVDVLINNAARNPKVEDASDRNFSRLENFPIEQWRQDLDVGLGGAFLCAQVFGTQMALAGRGGVIINIASDLGVIAPDQRLYRVEGLAEHLQPVKPVTYSVVKHGLLGLTKYLATYWCEQGVRCNALSPGGVYAGQNDVFVSKLAKLIPMGRMAEPDEYRGAIAFLCSDASAYLNGANLVMDGGRSVW